jgi:diguanylate cyclase (GGDEF)-like protein
MDPMCAVGLYATDIQPDDVANLDRAAILAAATGAIATHGERGCAVRLAMQFWENPSLAMARMQWALDVVQRCQPEGARPVGIIRRAGRRLVRALTGSARDGGVLLHMILPALAAAVGTDDLTGLATRERLMHRLATSRSQITEVAVIDVNDLKIINDGPGGHAAGDQLLLSVARAIQQASGEDDLVARTGGDEFTVFVGSDRDDRNVPTGDRIREALLRHRVSAAVGAARVCGGDVETAWKTADKLMYDDKHIHQQARAPSGARDEAHCERCERGTAQPNAKQTTGVNHGTGVGSDLRGRARAPR